MWRKDKGMQIALINEKALKVAKRNQIFGRTVNDHFVDPSVASEWLNRNLDKAELFKYVDVKGKDGLVHHVRCGEMIARQAKSPYALRDFQNLAGNASYFMKAISFHNVIICNERDGFVETTQVMATQNTSGNPDLKIYAYDQDGKLNFKKGCPVQHSFVGVVATSADGRQRSICAWYLVDEFDFNGQAVSYYPVTPQPIYELMRNYLRFILAQNGCDESWQINYFKKSSAFLKKAVI